LLEIEAVRQGRRLRPSLHCSIPSSRINPASPKVINKAAAVWNPLQPQPGLWTVPGQLQLLEKLGLGHQPWQAHLCPASPRPGEEASRSARCTDPGRPPAAAAGEAPNTATGNSTTIARRSAACSTLVNAQVSFLCRKLVAVVAVITPLRRDIKGNLRTTRSMRRMPIRV